MNSRRAGVTVGAGLQRGFTIIEALIALVLLIGVMLVLAGIVPATLNNASRDGQAMQAATAAQEYLDALRYSLKSNGSNTTLPTAALIAVDAGYSYAGSNTPQPSPGNFTLANNGCPFIGGSNRMYDCIVTAAWTENGQPRAVQVESYVTSQK